MLFRRHDLLVVDGVHLRLLPFLLFSSTSSTPLLTAEGGGAEHLPGARPDVRPERQRGHRDEDDVEEADAVLGHQEGEEVVLVQQVRLRNVHVHLSGEEEEDVFLFLFAIPNTKVGTAQVFVCLKQIKGKTGLSFSFWEMRTKWGRG